MQQQGPLLSIITINYNNAQGLKQTMQSVLDLEFKDYEYIIIDGGSTDDSVDIIKYFIENTELKTKISFWCSEKDNGIYNAMNKGLSHVNGTLVNMMNSGDCFISDALNKLPIWERENKNAVLYGAVSKWQNGEFAGCVGQPITTIQDTPLCHQATLIPVAIHKNYGLYDEQYKIYADYELFNRLKKNNVSVFSKFSTFIFILTKVYIIQLEVLFFLLL